MLKTLGHADRLRRHRRGDAFVVCGYPRSGTTMLSELVAMVTSYYFDRDNIFPATGRMILHTHWDPRRFVPERSLCVVRNPEEVAISVRNYWIGRGWGRPEGNPLAQRRTCRMSWLEYTQRAEDAGLHIVDYTKLVARDASALNRLAEHLAVPSRWLRSASELLAEIHSQNPHESDLPFKKVKAEFVAKADELEKENLLLSIEPERAYYSRLVQADR